jgi:YbbR domain-containing protein
MALAPDPDHHMKAWFDRFLSERARLFLLSLALAVTLWFYVGSVARPAQEGPPTATMRLSNVEVTLIGLANGWRATTSPESVDLEMRWPASAVLGVRPRDVQAVADVTGLAPGTHQITLRIQVPSGVTSVQANPPAVVVTLTRP